MSKISKSNLAMKLLCPAYKFGNPDPHRMEIYKTLHEQIRLQYRKKKIDDGYHMIDSEMPIENEVVKGRIDDIIQDRDGRIWATEYVSSIVPKMYKHLDAAIAAGFLTHELDIPASAKVVSRGAIEHEVPDELVEETWEFIMSPRFQEILSLSDDELLEYANPASGICAFCANKECRKNPY